MHTQPFVVGLLVATAGLAQPVDDPWSMVPAAPAGCYSGQDDFGDAAAAALDALSTAIDTQQATNDAAGHQVSDAIEADPFAMAQRMQEFAMQNPEQMAKMMEGLYATGQTIAEDMSAEIAREQELIAAIDELMAAYESDFADMRAPIDARVAALPTKVVGEGFEAFTDEALAMLPDIDRQSDAAYKTLCADWWQPGPFAAKLADYRAFLTDEKIPRQDEIFEQARQQWEIQGVDTSEARSIGTLEAARDYLGQLQRIYALRVALPDDLHVKP